MRFFAALRMTMLVCLCVFSSVSFAQDIPFVTDEMRTAKFWIDQQSSPDQLIMDQKAILEFNRHIRDDLKMTKDLGLLMNVPVPAQEIKSALEKTLDDFSRQQLFINDNTQAGADYFEKIQNNLNLNIIPDGTPRLGFVTAYADLRFLPTKSGLYAKPGDIDFDELQNDAMNIGSPVLILHESLDKQWFYVKTEFLDGWMEASKVGICSRTDCVVYFPQSTFVVISAKASIYSDPALTQSVGQIQMGTKLVLTKSSTKKAFSIYIPYRDQDGLFNPQVGFIRKDDVSLGFLPFTQRSILNQAFKLLGKPYGWGGINGEQDCSRFLQEVFDTVGIRLPRNSSEQGKVGKELGTFTEAWDVVKKAELIASKGEGALTLLRMKGHIMLYLGSLNNRLYAIHATWAYRRPVENGNDEVCVLNSVVVSDLSLGEGSKKGSLLKRITDVRGIY